MAGKTKIGQGRWVNRKLGSVRSTRGKAVGSGQGRFRSKASGGTKRRTVSPTLRRQR